MTNQENCAGTYEVSGYTRADGTRVSSYTRTCGAAHNSANSKMSEYEEKKKMQRRAELLFYNTKEKTKEEKQHQYTSQDEEIAGVKRGEPMTLEEAGGKHVNPDYSSFGNMATRTNCQSSVAVFEARLRGYDIETAIPQTMEALELKDELVEQPNLAYIDPITGKIPEFTRFKATTQEECEQWLNNNIKQGERYIFGFKEKKQTSYYENFGHILEVMKDENNQLKFYDPQVDKNYDKEFLIQIKFKFEWNEPPFSLRILRVDDKELNYKVLNMIAKPARKNIK